MSVLFVSNLRADFLNFRSDTFFALKMLFHHDELDAMSLGESAKDLEHLCVAELIALDLDIPLMQRLDQRTGGPFFWTLISGVSWAKADTATQSPTTTAKTNRKDMGTPTEVAV